MDLFENEDSWHFQFSLIFDFTIYLLILREVAYWFTDGVFEQRFLISSTQGEKYYSCFSYFGFEIK